MERYVASSYSDQEAQRMARFAEDIGLTDSSLPELRLPRCDPWGILRESSYHAGLQPGAWELHAGQDRVRCIHLDNSR